MLRTATGRAAPAATPAALSSTPSCPTAIIGGMKRRALFAERFLTALTDSDPMPNSSYDEDRGYTVTSEGKPFVELAVVGATVTITRANAEPDDDDPKYEQILAAFPAEARAQLDKA
jgi:hypothetical protein